MSWLSAIDKTLNDSKLVFADGSSRTVYAGESMPFEDGLILGEVNWTDTIDLDGINKVEIMEEIIELK